MSLRGDLAVYLSGLSRVTDVVGVDDIGTGKVYYAQASAREELPYIVVTQTNKVSTHDLRKTHANIARAVFQVSCFATDTVTVENAAEAVRVELDSRLRSNIGTTDIHTIRLENEFEDLIEPTNADELPTFAIHQEYFIWYAESVPLPT